MLLPISAIICTYNRADFVVRAIDSLANQTLDIDNYEILVIDNGSSDDTKRRIDDKILTSPNLRYVNEARLGLSIARNTGLASSRGHILAFLDDDAIACPDYLEKILATFKSYQPTPGLLCGPVEPIWGATRPNWLKDDFLGLYSVLNWSKTPRPLIEGEWIVGANFAIERSLLSACGGFNESLGRKGESLLSGEDTALTDILRARGYIIYYAPAVAVQHYIHPDRLSKAWFYRRIFWGAVSEGVSDKQAIITLSESVFYICRIVWHSSCQFMTFPRIILNGDYRVRWTRAMAKNLGKLHGFLFHG